MALDPEEQLRLVEDYKNRLEQLERGVTNLSKQAVRASVNSLMADLKKAYGRYKDSMGKSGARVAGEQAKRLANIINIAEDLLSPDEVNQWQSGLEDFLQEADDLGQELIKTLNEDAKTRNITQGVREQIVAAAASASKWLDYESEKTRKAVVGLVTQGVANGWGPKRLGQELIRQLPQLYGEVEKIVRTEMSTAYLEAQRRMTQRLSYNYVRWVATEDERTCPNCASRSGLIFRLEEVVMPAHPLCRCSMVPVPNRLVEAQDAELLNEADWGQHREDVAAEFMQGKIRKLASQAARAEWSIDRVMAVFDKHRHKPTPFERIQKPNLGDEDSAKPINVLGDDADPTVDWRD